MSSVFVPRSIIVCDRWKSRRTKLFALFASIWAARKFFVSVFKRTNQTKCNAMNVCEISSVILNWCLDYAISSDECDTDWHNLPSSISLNCRIYECTNKWLLLFVSLLCCRCDTKTAYDFLTSTVRLIRRPIEEQRRRRWRQRAKFLIANLVGNVHWRQRQLIDRRIMRSFLQTNDHPRVIWSGSFDPVSHQ